MCLSGKDEIHNTSEEDLPDPSLSKFWVKCVGHRLLGLFLDHEMGHMDALFPTLGLISEPRHSVNSKCMHDINLFLVFFKENQKIGLNQT